MIGEIDASNSNFWRFVLLDILLKLYVSGKGSFISGIFFSNSLKLMK